MSNALNTASTSFPATSTTAIDTTASITSKPRYILYAAKALSKAQISYPATRKELLAIVWGINRCRQYVYGRHFKLYTDHKALTYLFTQKHLNYMLLNWLDTLLDYDFKVIHRPGIDMLLPDTLSRIYASNTLSDSTHISSSPLLRINALSMNELVSYPDTELRTFVANRFDLRFVPVGERQALLTQAHVNGHFGSDHLFRTLWLSGVFWPSMRRDCISHVSTCLPCLRFNVGKRGYHPQRVITAKFPFQHIAVDTITGFKTTNRGNNCILVITDICTRFSLIIAQPTWQALDTARSLWSVLCTFPLPQIIQSDNGPEYVNKVIRALTTLLGIDHRLVAPYNPRANGSAENRVGLCQRILRKLTNGDFA